MQKINSNHVLSTHEFYADKSIPRSQRWRQNDGSLKERKRIRTNRENAQPDEREHNLLADGGGLEKQPWRITATASNYDSTSVTNESAIQTYGVCNGIDNWRKRFNEKYGRTQ
jgi:hypothetical protein